jgi:heme exporter protein A
VLTINSLSCERGERLLFSDLSLVLPPGEILQVIGRNGTGKSSLLKILAGLARPLSGTVSWNEQNIENDRAVYHAMICYLGHLDGIKAGLSVAENLHFNGSLMHSSKQNAHLAIAYFGLQKQAHTLIGDLSAGQKRRAALTQLYISSAKLWILDEPFTSLDKESLVLLEQLFAEHCAKGGMIIAATHQMLGITTIPVTTCELG